jgi:hypothetical protein
MRRILLHANRHPGALGKKAIAEGSRRLNLRNLIDCSGRQEYVDIFRLRRGDALPLDITWRIGPAALQGLLMIDDVPWTRPRCPTARRARMASLDPAIGVTHSTGALLRGGVLGKVASRWPRRRAI